MKYKKLISILLVTLMLTGALSILSVANAETYGDLTYEIANGEVTITDCNESATSVTIPSAINGYPVTTIGDDAFRYCDSLTSIEIPDSVTTIGELAFFWCERLTSIEIPNSVTTIGYGAFSSCERLTGITIGDSVTTIGNGAFRDCYSLKSITIPDSVTTIGAHAFHYCRSLTGIEIPDSVTTIGNGTFSDCARLTSIEIPDSVTTIGGDAFAFCEALSSITIPDSVTTIGGGAFYYCRSLTSITIGDSVTTIGNEVFSNCSRLESITIGDSVTTIGEYAFDACRNLKNVTYIGSEQDRSNITIGIGNSYLLDATWTYHEHVYDNICDDTCNDCGRTRIAPHSFVKRNDDFEHYDKCTLCRIEKNFEEHSFDNTCDATCNGCEYIRDAGHNHEYNFDQNGHFQKCTVCGDIQNIEEHLYYNECDSTCNRCDFVRNAPHSFVKRNDDFEHYDKCTLCRIEVNIEEHSFDNTCDTTCNGCDYMRNVEHSYEYYFDQNGHFQKCNVCGNTQNTEEHLYYNDCDTTCNRCDFTRTITHSYTNSCDESCNVCGEQRTITHSYAYNYDSDGHFDKCTVCGDIINRTTHVYDNVCGASCVDCNYVRTAPHSYVTRYDNYEHYDKCTICRIESNIEEHSFDNSCDTICNGCDYTRAVFHNWGEWVYDKATETETRTCSVCGESETRDITENPTYRPDEHMPYVTLNESGNGVVLDQNKSWATRVYWGCIGEEKVEYKWFDEDFRLLCGTDYFADYSPQHEENYNFTKKGWYRFVVKGIRTGTSAKDYTYTETAYDFYYDGTVAPTVPTVEELGNNRIKVNYNGSSVAKFYYGNIGQKNTPYSWFNDFWGTALATKTYQPVFDSRDGRIITLQTKGYYNIVIVLDDGTEYIYTTYADDNAPVIKKTEGGAIVDIDCLKGNVGTKATLGRIYYGYIGEEDKEIATYDELKANSTGFTGDSSAVQGKTYALKNKGYYKFLVVATLSNGKAVELIYTVQN